MDAERKNRTPKVRLPVQQTDLTPFSHREKGEFNSTWLGHSSLMINMDGFRILLDPVFEQKVSIVGPKRFNGPAVTGGTWIFLKLSHMIGLCLVNTNSLISIIMLRLVG